MQSATGQYSTHAGDPAHPVQHSLITARMCGLRLRCVVVPVDFGSYLTTDPALNSSMSGAPYDTMVLHQSIATIYFYSCRHHTACQSGRSCVRSGRTPSFLSFFPDFLKKPPSEIGVRLTPF